MERNQAALRALFKVAFQHARWQGGEISGGIIAKGQEATSPASMQMRLSRQPGSYGSAKFMKMRLFFHVATATRRGKRRGKRGERRRKRGEKEKKTRPQGASSRKLAPAGRQDTKTPVSKPCFECILGAAGNAPRLDYPALNVPEPQIFDCFTAPRAPIAQKISPAAHINLTCGT